MGFAGFAVGAIGQQASDPDLIAIPDMRSYAYLPFIRDGLAVVQCDVTVDGAPWAYAPRAILRGALERVHAAGYEAYVGAEVEYFLLRRTADGGLAPADERDTADQPCYDARGVTRMYEHLTAASRAMNSLGWGNYANDHEDANGQFEQNFHYADALTTADRVVTLRYVLHMLAEARGMVATFMPKPFTDRTGSGLHLHVSLRRDDSPLFPDPDDPHGLGLSRTAYAFVGGLLDHVRALSAIACPTVNSYKRTGARNTASGATWSPRTAGYGGNDRTHFIRVPDQQRVEIRGGDGAANPYLHIAAVLAAGLDGLDRGLDPGPPTGKGAITEMAPTLPRTLLDAVAALEADPVVCGALDGAGHGQPGATVSDYFCDLKREEFYAWHSQVSTWEIDRYLTAI